MKYILTLAFCLLTWSFVAAQKSGQRHDDLYHIFWNADRPLQPEDFQLTELPEALKDCCGGIQLPWMAATSVWAVLDIPKKKRDQKRLLEKVYFVPAFEPGRSIRLTDDSLDFAKQALVFDLEELQARKARKTLAELIAVEPNSIGIRTIFFKTAEAEAKATVKQLVAAYTREVYVNKLDGAYAKWRKKVDEMLEETKEFATTEEDRRRFETGAPLSDKYRVAPKVVGKL